MSVTDWIRGLLRPAPRIEPETPAERGRREIMAAMTVLQAHGVAPTGRHDALLSSVMGMGDTLSDQRETIQPAMRGFFNPDQLDALYMQGGLFRRISEGPAVDATRGGWRTDDARRQDITTEIDRRLALRGRLLDALRFARAYGRSHLLKITDDGAPMSEPLDPRKRHRILKVVPFMRREAIPYQWCSRLADPSVDFGEVELWQLVPIRLGVFAPSTPVHASRLLTIRGMDAPLTLVPGFELGRGLSAPDVYWATLRDLVASTDAVAVASLSMSLLILKLGAHAEAYGGDDRTDYLASLKLMRLKASTFGMLPLAAADAIERVPMQFTGIKEAVTVLQERVCAIEGVPATKLFGQAPGGLSTDNEAGRASYGTFLSGLQIDKLEPVLHDIYNTEMGPGDRTIVWGDVEKPSPKTQAETELINAQRDAIQITNKVIRPSEARARYQGDEVLPFPVVDPFDMLDDLDDLDIGEPTEPAGEE